MKNLALIYPQKIRVTYLDPDATDSSSDEEIEQTQKNSKRKVHVIDTKVVEQKEKSDLYLKLLADKLSNVNMGSSRKFLGVRKRYSGRYSAEIRDPFIKKRVWIGTFDTAEEASMAYATKKLELDEKRSAKQGSTTDRENPLPQKKSNLRLECFSKKMFTALQKSSNRLGKCIDRFEEASIMAYSEMGTSSDSSNNDDDSALETTGGAEFGFLFGVRVVDDNGFLIGEFAKLDDLSICSDEDAIYSKDGIWN